MGKNQRPEAYKIVAFNYTIFQAHTHTHTGRETHTQTLNSGLLVLGLGADKLPMGPAIKYDFPNGQRIFDESLCIN